MPADPTYTYSANPATDTKDAVRALLMDTNPGGGGWLLSDQEILWAIENEGNQYFAAAACAEMIAGRFTGSGRDISEKRVGDLAIRYGFGRGAAGTHGWGEVARALRRRAARGAMPAAGGIVQADHDTDATDPTLVQPAFRRGAMDNPPST